jgi:predicted mannosyl-3-phosphoglycerate phosphatase (HAD superfamily)
MGLLSDDTNTDEKYNVEKEASAYNKDNAKEWIKSTLTKRKEVLQITSKKNQSINYLEATLKTKLNI